jgi:hypothetical protein
MTTAEPPVQEFQTPRDMRRGVVAGVVGNMLEWYDLPKAAPNRLPREFEARAAP